ncbi:hypothetical protein BX266_7297 [Streptomyces sp. TLI_171]|nr:hypothetical protein BX266_7297 [Streptomyces sp. TLI_171]
MRKVLGQALADYFNGGAYGGFSADDREYDVDDVDLS